MAKPRVAVYKFTSCDGCQLAFLNAGNALLTVAELIDIVEYNYIDCTALQCLLQWMRSFIKK